VVRLGFTYRTGLSCPYQDVLASKNFTPPEPLVDGTFSVEFSVANVSHPSVSGSFSSHTDASGEIELVHSSTLPFLCEERVEATWSANSVEGTP
jgi:hypothetical protein